MRLYIQGFRRLLVAIITFTFVAGAIGFIPTAAAATTPNTGADIQDWKPAMNKPEYWEYDGYKCVKHDGAVNPQEKPGKLYRTIVKGGQNVNVYDYLATPGTVYRPDQPNADISWTTICRKPKPPKPEPKPEPELRIQVACVAHNSGGERKVVRTRVYYDTDGVQMVLRRKVVIDGRVRMNNYRDVWADGLWINSYHKVGYGKHRVRVVAKMGGLRVVKTKTVYCDRKPIVEVCGPCGDPYYGVKVVNRTADGKRLVVRLDGRVVVKRWVPRYSRVVTEPFFAEGGQKLTVRLDGKLVASEITKGGTFPWNTRECKILRSQGGYA